MQRTIMVYDLVRGGGGLNAHAWLVVLIMLAAACGRGERPPAPRIAITVDDLPWNGPAPPEGREVATQRLLATLEAHGAPAAGFVTCGRVPTDAPVLRLWLERGMTLGNHSQAHWDLNSAPLDLWLEDVRACDALLQEVTGGTVRFFRYPMLHQGPTDERQQAALALLRELDYRIAHVTVDNSEFMLSRPYEEALRSGDEANAERIGRLLVEHIVSVVHHARDVARRKVGRDVDQVLLLHATELVADHMDALLDALAAEGFLFISLEEALADPVFQLPDAYTGPKGLSWLYRIEPLDPQDVAWDDAQAEALREALQALRN
ncbi:MAG: polysaccharide deacetylase family protein [Gemmatimonadota bacterium]|nr:MAG: polysaccharide deacetylase family protein [Gemmatimonadota bacterium]